MLAEKVDYVIGVDTHRDQHTLAIVVAPTGAVVAQQSVATSTRGYGEAVAFAERYAAGVRVWASEGAGHYGTGFTRYLSGHGESMIEVGRTARAERRLRGKDDPIDALRAARSALASEIPTLPRAGQRQEALRVLLLARRSAVDVRRLALVQLRSVIVTAPESLREELRHLPVDQLIRRCSRFRRSSSRTPDELAIVLVLRSLARRIEAATDEAKDLEREIVDHVRALVPELLNEPGVGPIVAAQLIVTWSHRDRVRSEAAFTRLAASHHSPHQAAKQSGTASAAAATANSTVPSTPSCSTAANTTRHQGLHRSSHRRRQERTRRNSHPQALPRPPPLPTPGQPGSGDDLTNHRSVPAERSPMPA